MVKWKDAIANGTLKIIPTTLAQSKGIYPNTIAHIDGHPRVGAVVVFQSDADFALGKAGLDYVTAAKAEGRLDEGWVLLLRRKGNAFEFVNAAPLEVVAGVVANTPSRMGQWGEFWWLPAEIEVTVPF
jgi:hypothetical protein